MSKMFYIINSENFVEHFKAYDANSDFKGEKILITCFKPKNTIYELSNNVIIVEKPNSIRNLSFLRWFRYYVNFINSININSNDRLVIHTDKGLLEQLILKNNIYVIYLDDGLGTYVPKDLRGQIGVYLSIPILLLFGIRFVYQLSRNKKIKEKHLRFPQLYHKKKHDDSSIHKLRIPINSNQQELDHGVIVFGSSNSEYFNFHNKKIANIIEKNLQNDVKVYYKPHSNYVPYDLNKYKNEIVILTNPFDSYNYKNFSKIYCFFSTIIIDIKEIYPTISITVICDKHEKKRISNISSLIDEYVIV